MDDGHERSAEQLRIANQKATDAPLAFINVSLTDEVFSAALKES